MMRKILCLGIALGMMVAILSCGGYDPSPANRGRCQTNMAVIWQKLRSWSDNKGGTPLRLEKIYPFPLKDRTLFRCPSSSDDPTSFGEGQVLQPHQCSYIYNHLGAFTALDLSLQAKLIVLYEKKSFHGPGRNVAFAGSDGGEKNVRYLETDEFKKALAFTKDWMSKNIK